MIKVFGRTTFGYPVDGTQVTQERLEDLVFELPEDCEVLFWRARAEPGCLHIEMEVAPDKAGRACGALTASIDAEFSIPCEVVPLPPGTLVPQQMLSADFEVVKPRSLFGPGQDWSKAIVYS